MTDQERIQRRRESRRKWAFKNPDYHSKWRRANIEKYRTYTNAKVKEYYHRNKEKCRARARERYHNDGGVLKNQRWRKANIKKCRATQKRYYHKNHERILARQREWLRKNRRPESHAAQMRDYRLRTPHKNAQRTATCKAWTQKNRAHVRSEYRRRYQNNLTRERERQRAKNKRLAESQRRWRQLNIDKVRIYARRAAFKNRIKNLPENAQEMRHVMYRFKQWLKANNLTSQAFQRL